MARKTASADVEQPRTGSQKPGDWSWNVWKGATWVGFFLDSQTALNWVDGRQGYTVNNFPPTPASPRVARVTDRPPLWESNHTPSLVGDAGRTARPGSHRVVPARRVTAPAPQVTTPEMAKVKASAKKRLDQIKVEEAADIAAGADTP